MALTPLVMLVNEKLVQPRFGTKEKQDRPADVIDAAHPVLIAGFGRFGSVVGRLLRANGVPTTVLDVDSDHVDVLRKLGIPVYYGDACRPDLLHVAGAEHARLIIIAIDDPEKVLELVHTVRKHYPKLPIFARATSRAHAYELLEAGVEHVYRETLDSSIRLGTDALRVLGVGSYQAVRAARLFRRQDELNLRELAKLRNDKPAYVNVARQRIADMERVLTEERKRMDDSDDAAWDTDSLRQEYGGESD